MTCISSLIEGSINGELAHDICPVIDETEPLGLMDAAISFNGWHFDDLNNETPPSYHAIVIP